MALSGVDADSKPAFKVVRFAGIESTTLPIYLTLGHHVLERPYSDGQVKPVAYNYYAAVSNIKPESVDYLEVAAENIPRFDRHRTDKTQWDCRRSKQICASTGTSGFDD